MSNVTPEEEYFEQLYLSIMSLSERSKKSENFTADESEVVTIILLIDSIIALLFDKEREKFKPLSAGATDHYWEILSLLQLDKCVEFVNTLQFLHSGPERTYIWLYLQLHSRNLTDVLWKLERILSEPEGQHVMSRVREVLEFHTDIELPRPNHIYETYLLYLENERSFFKSKMMLDNSKVARKSNRSNSSFNTSFELIKRGDNKIKAQEAKRLFENISEVHPKNDRSLTLKESPSNKKLLNNNNHSFASDADSIITALKHSEGESASETSTSSCKKPNSDMEDFIEVDCFDNEKGKKIKNSYLLEMDKLANIRNTYRYSYPVEKKSSKENSLPNKCSECGVEISKSFFKLWESANFCHYTEQHYCKKCISDQKCLIPSKIMKQFDFNYYTVSKAAYKELQSLQDKPILSIDIHSPLVLSNKSLYDVLVMKKQLYYIYETICNTDIAHEIFFPDRWNFLLRDNYFSVNDLLNISKGKIQRFLFFAYKALSDHFKVCKCCQKKGNHCLVCNDVSKIFIFDIINTSICKNCKKIFHTKCLKTSGCLYCKK